MFSNPFFIDSLYTLYHLPHSSRPAHSQLLKCLTTAIVSRDSVNNGPELFQLHHFVLCLFFCQGFASPSRLIHEWYMEDSSGDPAHKFESSPESALKGQREWKSHSPPNMIDLSELQHLGIDLTADELSELSRISYTERSDLNEDVVRLHSSLVCLFVFFSVCVYHELVKFPSVVPQGHQRWQIRPERVSS